MTRYYFDLRDGEELAPDEEGLELNSMQAAQMEAAKSVADMVRDVVYQSQRVHNHRMAIEVRDDKGPVMQLKFTFEIEKKLQ
ncbi:MULTISPECIES: DUF6894 family protein [unclassified Bradyrhizobium]|jgi:hypothetical protein|uniref:DUF6894 family protein n=1 Tax=unclassified Bradyrhizobium TaxID=2631580 RepID=UPI0013E13F48|nr:hypothetical protein [Bradyrhizobium sp. 6(2017)]QIG92788.1 hypothetical protein G6P99_09895 [Bradyrhizobium sp. 6(2017)]